MVVHHNFSLEIRRMYDGGTEISDYAAWIDARYNGKRLVASSMSDAHEDIMKTLREARLTLNEIVTLFAGITSTLCLDNADANGASALFADEISRMIGDDDYDEDGEPICRTDTGGS